MPLSDTVEIFIQWLREQSFTPLLRVVQSSSPLPPAAYPCLSVALREERFTNAGTDTELGVTLRVECAAGRLCDAQVQARSLARQVRSALHKSHGLGGSARQLRTEGIDYSQRDSVASTQVAVAELHVALIS